MLVMLQSLAPCAFTRILHAKKQRGLQEKFFFNHEKFFCNPLKLCLLSLKPPCQQRRDKDIYHQHSHQLIGQDNRNILTHTHTG